MPIRTRATVARLVLVGALSLLAALLAAPLAAEPARPDAFLNLFDGEFTLTQRDGANCNFTGAPLTEGSLEMGVDPVRKLGRTLMISDGGGWRRNLRCNDNGQEFEGDMLWTAEYDIVAEGAFDFYATTQFRWEGTLVGVGSVSWFNCTRDGAYAVCPNYTANNFSFPVIVEGSLSCRSGGSGRIDVTNIGLPTSGMWTAVETEPQTGELFVELVSGAAQVNGEPLIPGCKVLLSSPSVLDTARLQAPGDIALGTRLKYEYICEDGKRVPLTWTAGGKDLDFRFDTWQTTRIELKKCGASDLGQRQADEEPLLTYTLIGGAPEFITAPDVEPVQVASPAAITTFGANSHIYFKTDPDNVATVVTSLQGQATVVPQNAALEPVILGPAQQVAVNESEVGEVIDLHQVKLPFISRD